MSPAPIDIPHGLIVSCQAPAESPLAGRSEIISALASAAVAGGAVAIRANGPADIAAIRALVSVPIIGLFKRPVGDINWITPSVADAAALIDAGADIVAVDATLRPRPFPDDPHDVIASIVTRLGVTVMADIDTVEAATAAAAAGAHCVGTTMAGYTPARPATQGPDLDLLGQVIHAVSCPVVAEGRFSTAAEVRAALSIGARAVVIGTAITDPYTLTRNIVGTLVGP